MRINQTYVYLAEDIQYFTKEVINNIANSFNTKIIYPNRLYWVEFEAMLLNLNTEKVLINRTLLRPYQFKYLSKELFNALEQEYYDNSNNDENLKLIFKYKFIDYFNPSPRPRLPSPSLIYDDDDAQHSSSAIYRLGAVVDHASLSLSRRRRIRCWCLATAGGRREE